jgi:hypothetical protein
MRSSLTHSMTLALAALAIGPHAARAADTASTNRIEAPPCAVLVAGPGAPASLECQLNGNADIRSWGEAVNGEGVLRTLSGAEVSFEAIERTATSQSRWLDGLVWLGGAVPSQVVFQGLLTGGFAIDISRGTISPIGVEQGRVTAQLQVRAGTATANADAALARDSSQGTGRFTEAVAQPVTLSLAWTPAAVGDTLPYEQRLVTSATATNAWFRQGAGSVDAQADFRNGSGLVSVRWLDAAGHDLGSAVQWAWTHELTALPVPEPGTPVLWLAGGLVLAAWARRCAVSAPSPSAGCRRPSR